MQANTFPMWQSELSDTTEMGKSVTISTFRGSSLAMGL